jgi:HEAT repeat protein
MAEAIPSLETDEGSAADASPDAPEQPLDAPPTEELLVAQLSDPDEQVRARALETLKDTADDVPVNALTQMAHDDASAERRIQALELLAERVDQKARGPLRRALADPQPAVRERARELIEDWHLDP